METRWYETASDPSNPEGPSTSTANTNDDTSTCNIIDYEGRGEPFIRAY